MPPHAPLRLGADEPPLSTPAHPGGYCWGPTPLPSQQLLRVLSGLSDIGTVELRVPVEGIVTQKLA